MNVNVLVVLIVLPMLATIGLYGYSFFSTRWSYLDENSLEKYTHTHGRERSQINLKQGNTVQLELRQIRHAFRSRYGLFGYCLDYKWLPLLMVEPQTSVNNPSRFSSIPYCLRSNNPLLNCSETGCAMRRCDNIPDCPSYIDEKDCTRPYNQTRYYWPEEHCMWQSTWIGDQALPRYLRSYENSPRDFHYYAKRVRYYVMFLLFVAAPLFILMALLILFCINCVERFYSIPFGFVSFFSLASFLSGSGALGIFLYEWIQERLHRPDFTYEFDQTESLIVALNPWLVNVEHLGLAFWLTVGAIGASLFTTILSFCFFCGLQSEKSKLRFHVKNDTYQIIQIPSYDDQ